MPVCLLLVECMYLSLWQNVVLERPTTVGITTKYYWILDIQKKESAWPICWLILAIRLYIGILSTSKHSAWLDSVSVIFHYYRVPPQGGWGRHSNAAKSHNNGGRQSDGVLAARSKPFCQIGRQQNACHRLASQWRHTMSHESVLLLLNTNSLNIAP